MASTSTNEAIPETATQAMAPLFAVCISFLILDTFILIARFFTVLVLRKAKAGLWWDDFWIIPAYIFIVSMIALGFEFRNVYVHELPLSANQALNVLEEPVFYPEFVKLLKYNYATTNLLMPVFFFTRMSILALYLRIFQGRKVRIYTYIVTALCVCQWVPTQIVAINLCTPIHKFWDRLVPYGHCVNINTYLRAIAYPTMLFDVFLIILPIPTVWQLRASVLRRTALSALFLTSVLALISSAYRTYVISTHDASVFEAAQTNVWMAWLIGETSIYLIVACLPTLAPLFQAMVPPSLRHAGHLAAARVFPSSSAQVPNGGRGGDFTRLVDSDATGQAVAEARGPKNGGVIPAAIELGDRARTPDGGARAQDLKNLEGGEGVLVHTEITVTTEERIQQVIGI